VPLPGLTAWGVGAVEVAGALAILLGTSVARSSFLLWVAVSYMVFLVADIAFILSADRSQ
jgi:uncharacterized membrane protein YphA (DoxX/SURF4 family)